MSERPDPRARSGPPAEGDRAHRGRPGRPGRGPMGGGMVGQKAMDFGPSAKRLIGRMRPEQFKAAPWWCSPSVSVA